MPRGDRVDAPRRADRVIDHEYLTGLLTQGLPGPEIVKKYHESGRGHIAISSVYAYRHHLGLPPMRSMHLDLIPWKLAAGHSNKYPAQMLRLESRHRNGGPLTAKEEDKRDRFMRMLEAKNIVVHYDPKNPLAHNGWAYVEKRDWDDVIRNPFRDDRGRRIENPRGLRSGAAEVHAE